jgi:hypothetical protein
VLTIRNEQLAAIRLATLEQQIARHLREEHRRAVKDIADGELRKLIAAGIARAGRHGIESGQAVALFVALMFEIAPNFDEHPAIRKVLSDEGLAVDARVGELAERISPEEWVAAQGTYDARAWQS